MRSARTVSLALLVLVAGSVGRTLTGCEIDPDSESATNSASTPPPRTVSKSCNVSPALFAGAPKEINGGFCFGVALGNSDVLRCAQRAAALTECVDELAGFSYFVRWTGDSGAVLDTTIAARQIGGVAVSGSQSFEVSIVQGQSLQAAGVCSFDVVEDLTVAKYCPYTF